MLIFEMLVSIIITWPWSWLRTWSFPDSVAWPFIRIIVLSNQIVNDMLVTEFLTVYSYWTNWNYFQLMLIYLLFPCRGLRYYSTHRGHQFCSSIDLPTASMSNRILKTINFNRMIIISRIIKFSTIQWVQYWFEKSTCVSLCWALCKALNFLFCFWKPNNKN